MKRQPRFIFAIIILLFVFAIPVYASEDDNANGTETIYEHCYHSFAFDFDDTTMTLTNGYTSNTVEWLMEDVKYYGDTAVVYKNGEVVSEGYLQVGMKIHIYHGDSLYGIYTIPSLRESSQNRNTYAVQSSDYTKNWILPVEGIILEIHDNGGNISRHCGSEYGGANTADVKHRGIDIASGGIVDPIEGAPILAVADGSIRRARNHASWGFYVDIDHGKNDKGENVRTLYAHMQSPPSVSEETSVNQGSILGYVGSTGDSSGPHLHFEVLINNEPVDPFPYLKATELIDWKNDGDSWYYYEPAGEKVKGWKTIDGKTYYFDQTDGKMSTGFSTVDGYKYYFESTGGDPQTSNYGSMVTGWKSIGNKFYYLDPSDGRMFTGMHIINGKTYFFDQSNGDMVTGWKIINGKTYYFEPSGSDPSDPDDDYGRIYAGWKIINGRTRYFELSGFHPAYDPDGDMCRMRTGWTEIGDDRYYFEQSGAHPTDDANTEMGRVVYGRHPGSDGKMVYDRTGWIEINGYTYYLNPEGNSPALDSGSGLGKAANGWTHIGTSDYYFRPFDRAMSIGLCTLIAANPKFTYYFCPDGYSPAEDPDSDLGKAMSGWNNIGENKYYFDPVTKQISLGLTTIEGKRYCFDPDSGIMQTGWLCLQDNMGGEVRWAAYYFDETTGEWTDAWHNYENVLADNTWEQIKTASELGLASHIWNVGDEKSFTLSTGETVTVQIYGFNHDDLTVGGKAGITFGLKNILRHAYSLNGTYDNTDGYTGTDMYRYLNGTIYDSLPEELRYAIKLTDKKTSMGGGSTNIRTSSMYLFLFSEVECFGMTYYSAEGEGEQYEIFTDDASRIKIQQDLQIIEWWLRSPKKDDSTNYCIVHSTGHAGYANAAWPYAGLCFGFCV